MNEKQRPSGGKRPVRERTDAVGAGLRQLWTELESEAVPDAFLDLLDAIDAERQKDDDKTAPDGSGR